MEGTHPMITFITALYSEAKYLIANCHLKKQPAETMYQLFVGEDIRLIITESGMISAAVAVARHFARFPSTGRQDLVISLGLAGLAVKEPASLEHTSIGELFLVSKITELTTGKTFYPDLLYQHSFRMLPLLTSPIVRTGAMDISEDTLLDMEASALYQALLPHFSPDRMLFFKVVSDFPGMIPPEASPELLMKEPSEAIVSYARELHRFLKEAAPDEIIWEEAELSLISQIKKQLPMTETMSREFERLLTYAKLSGLFLTPLLTTFLGTLSGTSIHGKKQAMPYLHQLRRLILETVEVSGNLPAKPVSSASISMYLPFFSTVYVEKNLWNEELPKQFSGNPVRIDHYKDIFNRSHQDFAAQKKAPSLILARKDGTLLYPGAPVCQSFGNEHFYYTSCMMNCIYHCDYCYLQGMYPSGHIVVFVNLTDYFAELEALLKKHPVYLCISYDTDLLALEQTFSFVSRWLAFAADHPSLTLEIRTKSGNPAVFDTLKQLYQGREALQKQIIFAWTVSPSQLCETAEHGAASLPLRLKALSAAVRAGFSVRLCFDPMILHAGWKENYAALVDYVFSTISGTMLYDVSIGVFRISNEYLKNMRKKRPDSAIVQYPYNTEQGVSHYGSFSEIMVHYLKELLLAHLPEEKIFVWNGGN